jgi:hypothetical protein
MNSQAIKTLEEGTSLLPSKDELFARDLVKGFKKKGSLSEKQWEWVEILADRIECAGVPDFTKEFMQVGDMHGVMALFTKAKEHLKYPMIVLQTKGGQKVALALAGPQSKNHGSVVVTDGAGYPYNKFFGVVSPDGLWEPSKSLQARAIKDDLTHILSQLAKRPAAVASQHGALTGNCCFCNTKLTDPKSTSVGYGPTCAKQWGLPWGAVSKAA